MITSYCFGLSFRTVRASSLQMRVRALVRHAVVEGFETLRGPQHRFAIFRHGQLLDRVTKRRAGGDAAAHAEYEHILAFRLYHQGQVRHEQLGREIDVRGGVNLAIDS